MLALVPSGGCLHRSIRSSKCRPSTLVMGLDTTKLCQGWDILLDSFASLSPQGGWPKGVRGEVRMTGLRQQRPGCVGEPCCGLGKFCTEKLKLQEPSKSCKKCLSQKEAGIEKAKRGT